MTPAADYYTQFDTTPRVLRHWFASSDRNAMAVVDAQCISRPDEESDDDVEAASRCVGFGMVFG